MRLIDDSDNIRYYDGLDLKKVQSHPSDGTEGVMIVFFNSLKDECKKYNRKSRISQIVEDFKFEDFNDKIDKIDNSFLILYETKGFTDIIYQSVRNRIENVNDHQFPIHDVALNDIRCL